MRGRRLARLACVLLGLTLVPAAWTPWAVEDGALYRLKVFGGGGERDRLAAGGFDIAGHNLREGWVEVIATAGDLQRLRNDGFEPVILERREGPRALGAAGEPAGATEPADSLYTDEAEMEQFLVQVAADHPSITRLETIGMSIQGRAIQAMLISDNAAIDEDELSILFSAAHHAREVMTPEVARDMIDHLTDEYGFDARITGFVDSYQIWIVPIVNPDGLHIVFDSNDFWRKNARDNDENGVFDNQDGVDINRNYEWGWGNQCLGSSGFFVSDTYRGTHEGSEPETQAMIRLGRRIRPVFDVEYHSYGETVFYAMGCDPTLFSPRLTTIRGGPKSISRVVAEGYAAAIVQADGEVGYGSAPFGSRIDGTGRDHQYHEAGAIGFVTEINNSREGGFQPDYTLLRDATVEGQRAGWLWLLDRMDGPAVGGHVLDAATGLPVQADVSLDELLLPDGKRLTSRADTGRFHIIVIPGAYMLRVSAPGYQPLTEQVIVGDIFEPISIELEPLGSAPILREEFEDAAAASDWTVGDISDTAVSGIWTWDEPHHTHSGDVEAGTLLWGNPGFDRTPGAGRHAFLTGNLLSSSLTADDVDGGATTLRSPSLDLSDRYAVEMSWHRWFVNDTGDPADSLVTEVSGDGGQSWITVETVSSNTATIDAPQSWTAAQVRLDDWLALTPDVRIRFTARDGGADNVVEAAIDDVEIRGFSSSLQGEIADLRVAGAETTAVSWQPVPGAPDAVYDVVRGEVGSLRGGAAGVDLGVLVCVGEDVAGTSTAGSPDPQIPPVGSIWFYLARFNLGFTIGGYGAGSDGGLRAGTGGCQP